MDLFWVIYLIDISENLKMFPLSILLAVAFLGLHAIIEEDCELVKKTIKIACILTAITIPLSAFFPSKEALALMYVSDTVTLQDIKDLLEFLNNVK